MEAYLEFFFPLYSGSCWLKIFCSGLVSPFFICYYIEFFFFFLGWITKYLKIILGTLTILLSSFGP